MWKLLLDSVCGYHCLSLWHTHTLADIHGDEDEDEDENKNYFFFFPSHVCDPIPHALMTHSRIIVYRQQILYPNKNMLKKKKKKIDIKKWKPKKLQ